MNIGWDRIAGWVALVAIGFALGIGFVSLRQRTEPAAVEIIPPEPTATIVPTTTPAPIRVYVTGAVKQPAVYELAPNSIIDDAVRAAGGFDASANAVGVNLAQPVFDGMQIYVPDLSEGAESPPPVTSGAVSGAAGSGATRFGGNLFAGLVNINTATAAELEALPGIGPSTAAKIIAYREEHGPFAAVEALLEVPGIGDAKLAAIRDLIAVGP